MFSRYNHKRQAKGLQKTSRNSILRTQDKIDNLTNNHATIQTAEYVNLIHTSHTEEDTIQTMLVQFHIFPYFSKLI